MKFAEIEQEALALPELSARRLPILDGSTLSRVTGDAPTCGAIPSTSFFVKSLVAFVSPSCAIISGILVTESNGGNRKVPTRYGAGHESVSILCRFADQHHKLAF